MSITTETRLAKPPAEVERLAALYDHDILDTVAEDEYDELTALVSELLGFDIALVSVVAEERQWFKSRVGLDVAETPRAVSFCDHAIREPGDVFEVCDARLDERFADNPLVTGGPEIRHYAAMPLVSEEGYGLGALCVISDRPGQLTDEQRAVLRGLGKQVMALLRFRRAARRVERERAALAAANDELARFSAAAAHDLRSPLRTIGSFAQLLRRRMRDRATAEEIEMFAHVTDGSARLSAMIEGLLRLARASHLQYAPDDRTDLGAVTAEVRALVDPTGEHLIAFEGEAVGTVPGPREAYLQILLNLVGNAVKYAGKPCARVVVSVRRDGDGRVCVTVADDGPGISPEDHGRIFRAFETGQNATGISSSGLGLATVRRIGERLGAKVTLESSPGQGSRFTVRLE